MWIQFAASIADCGSARRLRIDIASTTVPSAGDRLAAQEPQHGNDDQNDAQNAADPGPP